MLVAAILAEALCKKAPSEEGTARKVWMMFTVKSSAGLGARVRLKA